MLSHDYAHFAYLSAKQKLLSDLYSHLGGHLDVILKNSFVLVIQKTNKLLITPKHNLYQLS